MNGMRRMNKMVAERAGWMLFTSKQANSRLLQQINPTNERFRLQRLLACTPFLVHPLVTSFASASSSFSIDRLSLSSLSKLHIEKIQNSLAKTTAMAHPMNPTIGAHGAHATEMLPSL